MALEWPVIPVSCVTGEETLVNNCGWEAQRLASSTLHHVYLGHTQPQQPGCLCPAETGTCLSKHCTQCDLHVLCRISQKKTVLAQRFSLYSDSLILVPNHVCLAPFMGHCPSWCHQAQHLLFLATLWCVLETFWTSQITSLHFYTS